jgi:hypothetical protein
MCHGLRREILSCWKATLRTEPLELARNGFSRPNVNHADERRRSLQPFGLCERLMSHCPETISVAK